MSTKIEWTDETWNPVTGCTKISPGCANCYAERMARRLAGRCGYPEALNHFDVTLRPDRLEQPLKWKKPRMVFVCSMSDLFHDDVPDAFIGKVFRRMIMADHHTFQVLTKRPARMQEYLSEHVVNGKFRAYGFQYDWPPSNLWLGVTAENQKWWEKRRDAFFATPAAVHFLSYEPALGPLVLSDDDLARLDQVICGGESGPGARPMHPDWTRSLRDQCQEAGVPYFFKQWGAWKEIQYDKGGRGDMRVSPIRGIIDKLPDLSSEAGREEFKRVVMMRNVGKKAAGRLLDGREWNEMPVEDAR